MPLYDYKCEKCGKEFELMESITARVASKVCESCGGEATRVISSPAFHLKGGGWYVTDYKGGKGKGKGEDKPSAPCASADSASPACNSCAKAEN